MTTKSNRKQKKSITDLEMVPPDGGYGWIIVISYAIANVSEQRKKISSILLYVFQNFDF